MTDLASALSRAIRSGSQIDPEPFLGLPLSGGFDVQAEVFRVFGGALQGSKLSLKGDVSYSAPLLFASQEDGFEHQRGMAVEVELAFVLGRDITPAGGRVTRGDIVDAIAAVRIGVELVRSRYLGGSRGDPALAVADMLSNVGYVLGPELDRSLLDERAVSEPVSIVAEGKTLVDKPAAHADEDPLKAVVVLANQARLSPFEMLRSGQVITTGTLCGLVPVEAGKLEIGLGGRHFSLTLN